MAKSARSSSLKTNNQKLKKNVFGPVEKARALRLSTKLQEIAAQPKPVKEIEMMEVVSEELVDESKVPSAGNDDAIMEVDSEEKPAAKAEGKKRPEKRRGKKSNIVFAKFGERRTQGIRKKK